MAAYSPYPESQRLSSGKIAEIACKGERVSYRVKSRIDEFTPVLLRAMDRYYINTPLRQAHFIAQVLHESASLRYTEEIWGPTRQQKRYEPGTSLATTLGNDEEGDGYKFRGRGFIMLTGKTNYRLYGHRVGVDLVENPDLVESEFTADVAGWFWDKNRINLIADRGTADHVVASVTRRINGGLTHQAERLELFQTAKSVLGI